MTRTDGYYNATIHDVEFTQDEQDPENITAVFRLQFTDPTETGIAYHGFGKWSKGQPKDEHAERFKGVLEVFGIDGIAGASKLTGSVGQTARIRVKTNDKGKQRCYIATERKSKSVDLSDLNRRLADMADETLPF